MPKKARGLSAVAVRSAKPGIYVDGDGLMLVVKAAGSASWVLRFQVKGVRRDLGIGPARGLKALSLAEARTAARTAFRDIRNGVDVFADRRQGETAEINEDSFQKVAEAYIATHRASWRNPKHADQWESTLASHAYPVIGTKSVSVITPDDVLSVLEPIWSRIPESASRLRGRLEAILDAAIARGLRPGPNPAAWKGNLQPRLPAPGKLKRAKGSKHHPALPWRKMPEFMQALAKVPGISAQALRFVILTAARSGEVRGLPWGEIDLANALWIAPPERMKAGRLQRFPLSPAAVALLQELHPEQPELSDIVFSGVRSKGALSDMALTLVLRRMNEAPGGPHWVDETGAPITAHGFRSTFRDWCNEAASVPAEVAEAALAHVLKNKVEAAYSRSDHLDRRRQVMADWASFITKSD